MRTPAFAYAKTKTQISAFVFATQIAHFLYYLNPKFQVHEIVKILNLYTHQPVMLSLEI